MGALACAGATDVSFSAPQAERGHQLFVARCALCHGAQLEGVSAPSLLADAAPAPDAPKIGEVYDTILHRMPKTNPGSLSETDSAALVAFLLSSNGFPSGPNALLPKAAAASLTPFVRRSAAP